MTWKFYVRAMEQRRLFSRILQILESQMVSIRSFAGETNDAAVYVTFVVSSERDKAFASKRSYIDWKMFGACPSRTPSGKYFHSKASLYALRFLRRAITSTRFPCDRVPATACSGS